MHRAMGVLLGWATDRRPRRRYVGLSLMLLVHPDAAQSLGRQMLTQEIAGARQTVSECSPPNGTSARWLVDAAAIGQASQNRRDGAAAPTTTTSVSVTRTQKRRGSAGGLSLCSIGFHGSP